jgi:hypothetical protein
LERVGWGIREPPNPRLTDEPVRRAEFLKLSIIADSLESAKERVEDLGKFWPGKYVIVNQETGERLTITVGDEPTIH